MPTEPLGLWAGASVLCQRALAREARSSFARLAWAGADAAFLTAVLHIVDALESPLVALYPVLIACSGLWFKVPLVRLTTHLCVLGYTSLLLAGYWRHGRLQHLHWHLIFLAAVAITGFIIAYHVHRVSVLGRFCEPRPAAEPDLDRATGRPAEACF